MQKQTNWYVIRGGPSSGKTTTVNLLKEKGYITTFEHASHYLDTQRLKGRTKADVRKQQREFQLGFPIIHFPVFPPEERVDFILKNII